MNLIEQLQATPKWKEFEDGYTRSTFQGYIQFENRYSFGVPPFGFVSLPFIFQKGVFEKFIESRGDIVEQQHTGSGMEYSIWIPNNHYGFFDSFEELLIWYFNN